MTNNQIIILTSLNFIKTKTKIFMKRTTILSLAIMLFGSLIAQAQNATVSGKVTDSGSGEGLIGATVIIEGSSTGGSTDVSGNYSFSANPGSYTLIVSYIGYESVSRSVTINAGSNNYDFSMSEGGTALSEILVTGTRNKNRSVTETAVPIDVIAIDEIIQNAPQVELTQILNYVAPSFSSNKQTISDGTDHVDPASLRGLGVDHVLVLINGKRRHTSALVNVNGTVGRGSVGTDMNTIPTASIERIEILRDGASAQYGSDAIAGVINIVLKKATNEFTGSVMTGQMFEGDGEAMVFNGNYGFNIGDRGYINVTGQYQYRGRTDRSGEYSGSVFRTGGTGIHAETFAAGDWSPFVPGELITAQEATDINAANAITNSMTEAQETDLINSMGGRRAFSLKAGDSQVENAALVVNSVIPLSDKAEFYAFGTLNNRNGLASGFYRYANQSRTLTTIYPIGFLPEINSRIKDASISAGVRGEINGWDVDFSNTFGSNSFQFVISNTHNASKGTPSPTTLNSGGFKFKQNTTNLDFSRYFDGVMNGINLALGAEFRSESYQLLAGEEGSYRNYGNVQTLNLVDSTLNESTTNIFYGRPGGAQVFPGFSPANELLESRNAVGVYADVEFNFTENFFVDVAGRYENFTDFGDTFNGKIALRWAVMDNLAIRAAGSTGFRAPSLHQRYFNSTSTLFQTVAGVTTANEVGTFRNDSRVAQVLGVPSLKAENATNFSAGLTFDPMDGLSISIDGYIVNVDDRVTLTNSFGKGIDPEIDAALDAANASKAQLFVNGIDTETKGVDIVANYVTPIGQGTLNFILGANFTKTDVVKINIPGTLIGDPDAFFNRENRSQFETGTPQSKISLGVGYGVSKFHANANFVYFGEVTARTGKETDESTWVDQTFAGKMITDLSLGYDLTDNLNITVGASNLFGVVPDENRDEFRSSNRFVYSRRVSQFGANGGFYFARVNFRF